MTTTLTGCSDDLIEAIKVWFGEEQRVAKNGLSGNLWKRERV